MNGTLALHARRKNQVSDEEMMGLSASQRSIETLPVKRTNSRRLLPKQRLWEVQMTYVAVCAFVFTGFISGYLILHHQHRKVILHVIRNPWAHGRAAFHMATTRHRHTAKDGFHHHFYSGNPKFVTVVMPSVVNPNGRQKRLEAIHDTWGPYARAIYVLHDITEFEKASHLTMSMDRHPYDRYSFPQNLLLPEHINVDQGIARLYHTIQMIHERVNPDFAFFVNDHTYVIPAHLCHYLDKISPDLDLYAGHALKNDQSTIFNSGAAGYILSRETMKKIMQKYNEQDEHCWIDSSTKPQNSKWLEGNPGLVIVDCLRSMGIAAIDTREDHKYHRFHAFPLVRMVSGDVDAWYINKHQFEAIPSDLRTGFDTSYSTLLVGTDCCAKDSISFHYVEAKECLGLYKVQQALLDRPQVSDAELQIMMEQNWPTDARDVGGYSRKLPQSINQVEWSKLLMTLRNISTKETQTDC
jgi:hypothetical protein